MGSEMCIRDRLLWWHLRDLNEIRKETLYQRQSSKCKDPSMRFLFVCLWDFEEATGSDWSGIFWRIVGRCVLGEQVGLGVKTIM